MMIQEMAGGWAAFTSWGRLGGVWTRREAAEAVAALPVPDSETLLREIEYWKSAHTELVAGIREADRSGDWEAIQALHYRNTGGMMSSPLEIMALKAALKGHRSAEV